MPGYGDRNARLVVRVGLDSTCGSTGSRPAACARRATWRRPAMSMRPTVSRRWRCAASTSVPATAMPTATAIRIIGSIRRTPISSPPISSPALARVDPAHTAAYEANRHAFWRALRQAPRMAAAGLAPLQGMSIVAYHNAGLVCRRFPPRFYRLRGDQARCADRRRPDLAALISTMRSRNKPSSWGNPRRGKVIGLRGDKG